MNVLALVERLSEDYGTGIELYILHLDFHVLYVSNEEDFLLILIIGAAEYFVKRLTKRVSIPGSSICILVRSELVGVHDLYHSFSKVLAPTFLCSTL